MKRSIIKFLFLGLLTMAMVESMIPPPVPSTIDDFFMPGSQPLESGTIDGPDHCDNCHSGYDTAVEPDFLWKGSMMAQSLRDPLFRATMSIAEQDAPGSGDLCLRCHTPSGWLEGRSEPTDGSSLTAVDRQGISCDFCHRMVKPTEVGVNPFPNDPVYTSETYALDQNYLQTIDAIPPVEANGMYIVDNSNDKRGPLDDAASPHQSIYSPFHKTSEMCATCHDVSNPAFSAIHDGSGNIVDYAPNAFGEPAPDMNPHGMFPVERTYSEWKMSAYNTPDGIASTAFGGTMMNVSTCQDCHMPQATGKACNKNNAPVRDNLSLHDLTGANTFMPKVIASLYPSETDTLALQAGIERARYMLQNAATLDVTVDSLNRTVDVKITNETGHKLPSGYPEGRRMWINVKAWMTDSTFYESCHYDSATAVLTHDPDAKIYEIKPGLSPGLAGALGLTAGPSFHFVLNDTIYKDNRIPPRGFTNAAFDSIQSPPVGYTYQDSQYWDHTVYQLPADPLSVLVTVFYQSTSKEYVEFLKNENHSDTWGDTMHALWIAHGRSAPEVMVQDQWGAPPVDNDRDGFIADVDCNDSNPDIYPGAPEIWDCLDNDCDGIVDEDFTSETIPAWNGCAGTANWHDPANWNLLRVPEATEHVIIPGFIQGDSFPVLRDTVLLASLKVMTNGYLEVRHNALMVLSASSLDQPAALQIEGQAVFGGDLHISSSQTSGILISNGADCLIAAECTIENIEENGIEVHGVCTIDTTAVLQTRAIYGKPLVNQTGSQFIVRGMADLRK